jgi:hypothetical protein
MANKKIPPERKTLYYVGMILAILGALSFASVFVSGILNFGNFDNFESRGRSMALRAFAGMGMMIVGVVLMSVAARGIAGSGVILDPEKAREDIEPWSRMAGGIVKDALDETDLFKSDKNDNSDLTFDEKLRRLHKLRQDGIITEQEYQREKTEILENN